jgi:hypothetical protein
MDRRTFEALQEIISFAKSVNDPRGNMHPDGLSKEFKRVEDWMDEVEKEIETAQK